MLGVLITRLHQSSVTHFFFTSNYEFHLERNGRAGAFLNNRSLTTDFLLSGVKSNIGSLQHRRPLPPCALPASGTEGPLCAQVVRGGEATPEDPEVEAALRGGVGSPAAGQAPRGKKRPGCTRGKCRRRPEEGALTPPGRAQAGPLRAVV